MRRELNRIYELLLRDPSDEELNRRFIEVALRLKDYDAAIGAAERLLFFNKEDPELHLQTGLLYFEIESYVAARGYLQTVSDLPTATAEQVARANELIAQIDRATTPSPFAAVFQVGARYQTNANVAPASIGGENFLVEEFETPDWNWFALGSISHTKPLGQIVLESSLSGYYADQVEINRLDIAYGNAQSGPRLFLGSERLSIRPYAMGELTYIHQEHYQHSYGGGVAARLIASEALALEPSAEYRKRTYMNTTDYPIATDLSGDYYTYALRGFGSAGPLTWQSTVGYNDNQAVTEYRSYERYFADLSVRLQFELFGHDGWVIAPFAMYHSIYYAAIDPALIADFDFLREDTLWTYGSRFEIPLIEHAGLAFSVQYTENDSNYDRYKYINWQFSGGPTARF